MALSPDAVARVRQRYERMSSARLVGAIVNGQLSFEKAEIARHVLWLRESRERTITGRLRKLFGRLHADGDED